MSETDEVGLTETENTASAPASPTQTCLPAETDVGLSFVRGGTETNTDRSLSLPTGTTARVTVIVTYDFLGDLDFTFEAPWSSTLVNSITPRLKEHSYAVGRWTLDIPASAEGEYTLTGTADWTFTCQDWTTTIDQQVVISPVLSAPFGFDAGGWMKEEWTRIDGLWFDTGTEDESGTAYVEVAGDATTIRLTL